MYFDLFLKSILRRAFNNAPRGYSVTFNSINRAFLFDGNFNPPVTFLSRSFPGVTLTAANEIDGVIAWTAGP